MRYEDSFYIQEWKDSCMNIWLIDYEIINRKIIVKLIILNIL